MMLYIFRSSRPSCSCCTRSKNAERNRCECAECESRSVSPKSKLTSAALGCLTRRPACYLSSVLGPPLRPSCAWKPHATPSQCMWAPAALGCVDTTTHVRCERRRSTACVQLVWHSVFALRSKSCPRPLTNMNNRMRISKLRRIRTGASPSIARVAQLQGREAPEAGSP